jgi:ferredoxin-like protein FixX
LPTVSTYSQQQNHITFEYLPCVNCGRRNLIPDCISIGGW